MNFGILQMPTIIMRKGYLLILKIFGSVKISRQSVGIIQLVICRTLGYVYNPKYVSEKMQKTGVYY